MENITQDAKGVEEVQETSALEAGIFSPLDLKNVQNSDWSELKKATLKLVEAAQEKPYHVGFSQSSEFGRFDFGAGSKSAIAHQSAFRLIRAALDFLEADFMSCVEWEANHHAKEAVVFRGVLPKTSEEQVADLYWQVQECLGAANLSFNDLVAYHAQSDSEVQS